MGDFFRIDGPFYRFGNTLYYIIITNLLWILFSLPVVTIGASTTALYYVMGKVVRDEDIRVFKDFWKSFRQNFKQATVVWVILALVSYILYFNMTNMHILGESAKYFYPFQIAVLLETLITYTFLFPVLSRYELKTKELFRLSFFLGNRYILSTIACLAFLALIVFLVYRFTGLFILIFISLYAFINYFIVYRVLKKVMPQEKELLEQKANEADEE